MNKIYSWKSVLAFFVVLFIISGNATASTIRWMYDSDDFVTSLTLYDSSGNVVAMSGATGTSRLATDATYWWNAPTSGGATVALTAGETYSLVWDITNLNLPYVAPETNPLAFLAQVVVDGTTFLTDATSGSWSIANYIGTGSPSVAGYNFTQLSSNTSIYATTPERGAEYLANVQASGMDTSAYWITATELSGNADRAMSVVLTFTAATPIPPAALLLATSFLGVVGFRKRLTR